MRSGFRGTRKGTSFWRERKAARSGCGTRRLVPHCRYRTCGQSSNNRKRTVPDYCQVFSGHGGQCSCGGFTPDGICVLVCVCVCLCLCLCLRLASRLQERNWRAGAWTGPCAFGIPRQAQPNSSLQVPRSRIYRSRINAVSRKYLMTSLRARISFRGSGVDGLPPPLHFDYHRSHLLLLAQPSDEVACRSHSHRLN
jgi:hypothetical protein